MDVDEAAAPTKAQKKAKKQKGENGEAVAPPAEGEKKKEKKEKKEKKKESGEVKELAGGLQIRDVKIGEGADAKKGANIKMRYIGKLTDGKIFDKNTNGKPVSRVYPGCWPFTHML